ncbi:hypothetical protein [Vagococcus zengguangii]|uniref:Uncharacterized protein n=1 Tax=Vagococcus zengguangii TaxID=2571750 RepID=A0A4D7CXR7_9ENTE|nr:hypothetical protein [Vagococcus zengguangii]QCI87301.1 hypothetical protein FA707_10385 [Vagococcus zengguangii]TLG79980.1 hypothetical protein FE258_06515 [Vagococcus zengguangii]
MKILLMIFLTCLNIYLISYLQAWFFADKSLFFPLLMISLIMFYFIVALVKAIVAKDRHNVLLYLGCIFVSVLGPPILFLLVFNFQGYF